MYICASKVILEGNFCNYVAEPPNTSPFPIFFSSFSGISKFCEGKLLVRKIFFFFGFALLYTHLKMYRSVGMNPALGDKPDLKHSLSMEFGAGL